MKTRHRNRKRSELLLLQAAANLFSERGIHGVTTREIANKAEVAEGLISRYFGGKKGLAHTVRIRANELHIPIVVKHIHYHGLPLDFLEGKFTPSQQYVVNRIKAAIFNEFAS